MIRKIIITVLLFSFVLSACGSNVETIPTSTSIPTLQATSTFTPEPTATNTSIPTETPFLYTSCADPKFSISLDETFLQEVGETIPDYLDIIVQNGNYKKEFGYSPDTGVSSIYLMYVGSARISLKHLSGAWADDEALCAFFVSYADTEIKVPFVLGYTYQGAFNPTVALYDGRLGLNEKATYITANSISERESWLESVNGPNKGDLFHLYFQSFIGIDNFSEFEQMDSSRQLFYKDFLLILFKSLGDDFFKRLEGAGYSPTELAKRLSFSDGDVGLYANMIQWIGSSK